MTRVRQAQFVRRAGLTAAEPAEARLSRVGCPHRYVDGSQGLVHDTGQVIADRVQVDRVFQAGRERGHRLAGVIPGPG
jgi:hypothetical protein